MQFFTSDPHLGHVNILRLANRPFKSIDEMNDTIINNYNSVVDNNDTCYFLGDVVMGKRDENLRMIRELNGTKILILGNHDYPFEKRNWDQIYLDAGFKKLYKVLTISDSAFEPVGGTIRMQHFPVIEAGIQDHLDSEVRYAQLRLPSNGTLHLSGHTHLPDKVAAYKNIHVGVDAWNFYPVSLDRIIALYNQQGW